MISTTVLPTRNREAIDQKILTDLQQNTQKIINQYKQEHAGFFEEYRRGATLEILSNLEADIEKTIQSKDDNSFTNYVAILKHINHSFEALDEQKELNLIYQFQLLLKSEFVSQVEADWEEKECEEHMRSQALHERIQYSLNHLSCSESFDSRSQQDYFNKWKVFKDENKYSIWAYLIEHFNNELGDGYLPRLISEVRSKFGLKERSFGTGVDGNSSIYGVNVAKNERGSGYIDEIVVDAEEEIGKLIQEHHCITFGVRQNEIVDSLNSSKAVVKAKILIDNKEMFNRIIQGKIKKLGEAADLGHDLSESQWSICNEIKEELNLQAKLYKMNKLLDEVKYPTHNSYQDLKSLINKINNDDEIFSDELRERVKALEDQLEIWTLDNLMKLCVEYLKCYANESFVDDVHIKLNEGGKIHGNPTKYLAEEFIYHVIEKLINPLLYITENPEICFDLKSIHDEMNMVYSDALKKNTSQDKSDQESIATTMTEADESTSHVNTLQFETACNAIKLFNTDGNQTISSEVKSVISNNEALQMALSASYLYYTSVSGNTHGEHGREATLRFIINLLKMQDKTCENIQNEAIKYIKGEGDDYGTWYGGSSSYHMHSRISFILNSGLLDNRKGEIYPYQTSTKGRFFDHNNFAYHQFGKLNKEDREELTSRVGLLGPKS